jgi:hypothetical protein
MSVSLISILKSKLEEIGSKEVPASPFLKISTPPYTKTVVSFKTNTTSTSKAIAASPFSGRPMDEECAPLLEAKLLAETGTNAMNSKKMKELFWQYEVLTNTQKTQALKAQLKSRIVDKLFASENLAENFPGKNTIPNMTLADMHDLLRQHEILTSPTETQFLLRLEPENRETGAYTIADRLRYQWQRETNTPDEWFKGRNHYQDIFMNYRERR